MPLSHGAARGLRRRSTDAERLLWSKLRNRQLENHKFRRQQPIGGYIVDFVCLEQRLVVEVDGGQHALRQAEDERRSGFLGAEGYRVLRFWNNQVLNELDAVVEVIDSALAHSAHPSPNPLPQGERAVDEGASW
jgi:very-short-patch-repair endonuclease